MADIFENPIGTNGFEFVEFAAKDSEPLKKLFHSLGFVATARHKSRDITLYSQGDIVFLINEETDGFAGSFSTLHGPCACAMGFRVKDSAFAIAETVKRGAVEVVDDCKVISAPCIEGIGGSRLYLVDKYGENSIWDEDFVAIEGAEATDNNAGLTYLDHLTHNVFRGNMEKWGAFYEDVFNFRQIRYFDIEGKLTGLVSKAMTSPCGLIRIPINESQDDISQIAEYLNEYNGEGIQHIAFGTDDIVKSVDLLKENGVDFQDTIESYFDLIDERLPGHGEDVAELRSRRILVDGAPTEGQGILLQIFTKNVIGPIFFEIIQRKGNEGFGEGNFQALFDSIELDQVRRGVISAE
jgi:4-hydroxyphenylpyruvate dioxygenase